MLGGCGTEIGIQSAPDVDVNIVDGAALVHILDPKKSQVSVKTFHDYAQMVFLPYIERMLSWFE